MRNEIRAVIDTSTLVRPSLRRRLQEAARADAYTAIWSPWIIAELNRVLVWRWIKNRTNNDLSDANERHCGQSAKIMMNLLLSTFDLVHPTPPYPPAWETLTDEWDHPIWAAAVIGDAHYVVSENTNDYPPQQPEGR